MRMRHNGEIKILQSLSRLVPHAIAVAADTSDQQGVNTTTYMSNIYNRDIGFSNTPFG